MSLAVWGGHIVLGVVIELAALCLGAVGVLHGAHACAQPYLSQHRHDKGRSVRERSI